jgi:hypothetical protein
MKKNNQRFPQKLLIFGILLIITGGVLLMQSLRYLTFGELWPLPFLLIGLVLLYLVYFKGVSDQYILAGMALTLGGLFLFLLYTILPEKSLEKIWPAFMIIAGISLLPYAFRRKAKTRIGITISAIAIILLAILFFPFSLGIAGMKFSDFVLVWWPIVFIIIGLGLILYNLLHHKTEKKDQ